MSERKSTPEDEIPTSWIEMRKKYAGRDPFQEIPHPRQDEVAQRVTLGQSPVQAIREAYGPDIEPPVIETDASKVARIRQAIREFIENFKR